MDFRSKFFLVSIIAASLVAVLLQIPTFKTASDREYDTKLVTDLEMIRGGVMAYSSEHQELPASLDQLDPKTLQLKNGRSTYEYKVKSDDRYELCTSFRAETEASMKAPVPAYDTSMPWGGPSYVDFNQHPAGRHCFELSVYHYGKDDICYSPFDDSTSPEELCAEPQPLEL